MAELLNFVIWLPVAGMLLRSAAVSSYRALEVRAYADKDGTEKIDVLRLVELSPNVLLCLFPAIPERVDIETFSPLR